MSTVLTVQTKITGDATSIVMAAAKGQKAIRDLQNAAEKADGGFQSFGHGMGNVIRMGVNGVTGLVAAVAKVGLAAATAGGAVATAFAFKAVNAGLDRLTAIQDSTVALTRMLGSASAAAELTQKALKVVQGTPFAFPQFAEATRTLVAFGVSANKVPGVLQAIADSAAASGRGAAAVDGLTQAFANLQVQGKVSSDILQQLGTSGVNGLGILANAFGKSTGDMQKMISAGLVPADQAMDILVKGIEQGSHGIAGNFNSLAGAAQDLGQTVSGSLGNVKAAFARMGAAWLKPFETDLPKVLNGGVIPLLDKLGAVGGAAMQKLSDTGVLNRILTGLQSLTKNVDPAIRTFVSLARTLSPLTIVFEALKTVMPQVSQTLQATGQRVLASLVPALANLMKALVPILPIVAQLVSAFTRGLITLLPTVTGMINGLTGILGPLVRIFTSLPAPILAVGVALLGLDKAGVPIGNIISKFFELGTSFRTAGAGIDTFGGRFSTATEKMGGLKGSLGGVASFLGGPWGIAIGAGVTAIGLIAASIGPSAEEIDNLTASLDRNTGAFTKNTDAAVLKELQSTRAVKAAKDLGVSIQDLVKAAEGDKEAQARVTEQINKHVTAAEELARKQKDATGWEAAKNNANTVTNALGMQNDAIQKILEDNQDWLNATGAAKTAQDDLKGSLTQFTQAVATNTVNTDQSSAAYQGNKSALDELGGKAAAYVETVKNQYQSTTKTTQATDAMSVQMVAAAMQMGMTRAEAESYTAKLLGIPRSVVTTAVANTEAARIAMDGLETAVNRLDGRVVTIYAQANIAAAQTAIANAMRQANQYALGNVYTTKENGGFVGAAFENGGMRGIASFAQGGSLRPGIFAARNPGLIKFAEPGTHGEAFISFKPSQEKRNQEVTMQAAKRLGMDIGGGSDTNVNVTNHLYGVDPHVTADLISQGILAKLGW